MKWLLALVGYYFARWPGAIIGYLLGTMFSTSKTTSHTSQREYREQRQTNGTNNFQTQRNAFINALLLLSAHIIYADGKVMHSEMEQMRNFLRMNFGENAVKQGEQQLLKYFEQQKTLSKAEWKSIVTRSCYQIQQMMTTEERLQLISFLCNLAKTDKQVDSNEIQALKDVCQWIGLSATTIDQMLNLGGNTLEAAYKVLGISPDATDDEVRKAYRAMALANHPDRVASLGEDVRQAAEKKFKEINEAKERIFKARGMK